METRSLGPLGANEEVPLGSGQRSATVQRGSADLGKAAQHAGP